jgi:tripartite-type tricarboxylate transporter receptor subunit TctC
MTSTSNLLNLDRRRALQVAGTLMISASIDTANAQTAWPSKPIRLVLPSGPGGGADIFGRPLAEWLGKELGQPVVVDNKPGANGVIAHEQIVRQPGDGYNLVISFAGGVLGNKAMNA